MRATTLFVSILLLPTSLSAGGKWLTENIQQQYEIQFSASQGVTPLWLNANRYGLSSLNDCNGYARVTLERETRGISPYRTLDSYRYRPNQEDSQEKYIYNKGLKVGYGLDLVAPIGYKDPNHTTHFIIQQAYLDIQLGHGQLTIGSRQQPMELRNNRLASGAQTFGINARPVPQVRLGLHDFWSLPYTRGWVSIKGHISYGLMTDGQWQKDFTAHQSKWTEQVLYHEKAGYLKIGQEEKFPLTLTLGLEMASEIGGDIYRITPDGSIDRPGTEKGFKAFWHAFTSGGHEVGENDIVYQNVAGNQLGSWVGRLQYDNEAVTLGLYVDHFFEDHSAMFFLDYNGYGTGDQWNSHVKNRFFQYRLKDGQIGMDVHFKKLHVLKNIVCEWMNTRYQSGPIYHDHTINISDHISGQDDYYNHSAYSGWSYYGQVIGNPLYRSPLYNDDHSLYVQNNRFWALHMGLDGSITSHFDYRVMTSYQEGLGRYEVPFCEEKDNFSFMIEGAYRLDKMLQGLSAKLAFALDRGSLLGDNTGIQLTINYHL